MASRMARWGNDLYTGRRSYDVVGRRRTWFLISVLLLGGSIGLLLGKGLTLGIEFSGGTEVIVSGVADPEQQPAVDAVAAVTGDTAPRVTTLGTDAVRVHTEALETEQARELAAALATAYDVDPAEITSQVVGPVWGQDITSKALQGLVVFLALVALLLTAYFRDWRMAASALLALAHDMIITVGLYAAIGWEVTPATVIGFLTILGYSLYDTVVVFDKVRENVRNVLDQRRYTYGELANLAVNQTLVRSINTSVVAALPVASILFIGAFLLGAGTLRDISLVLFIGTIVGTFSSIFIATPFLVWLRQREPRVAAHDAEVQEARAGSDEGGGGTAVPVRVGALVPGEHQGVRAQPRRRRPNRPAGRRS